jgi:molybdopterin-guanine dinucleotide biosynthesis protein A
MGFDKATLMIDGKPLWQRQLATLRATQPGELLISGRPDGPYSGEGVPIIVDDVPDAGPLGGLATLLHIAKHPLVLVLAIDLPDMTAEWLARLVQIGSAIPVRDRQLEPLAAFYPKAAAPIAERLLAKGQRSMRNFAHELFYRGLAKPLTLSGADSALFRNLNTPEDVTNGSRDE